MGESTNGDVQRFKYNGKELDRLHGLDWYDYGARQMDGMRFTTVDPLAEKYYGISPYVYCADNPVNAIDHEGKLTIFINGFHWGWEGAYFHGYVLDFTSKFKEVSASKPDNYSAELIDKLSEKYDVFILSTAPWKNPSAWSDKVAWVTKYLDDVFHKRMIITHRKDLCKVDYLIDDRGKNGTSEFDGEWIQFGSEKFPDWSSILAMAAVPPKLPSIRNGGWRSNMLG